MYSTYCQYDYPIEVFVPEEEVPENGFPVLFVLDGQRYSKLIVEAMQNQTWMKQKTKVEPFIVVSIGHQNDETIKRRFYDFTAPAESYHFPLRRGKAMAPVPVGGAADFQQFIEQELMPYIAETYAVDTERYVLFGHSLGGLFSLWTYLTKPNLFHKYIAVSPSIWWNQYDLLKVLTETKQRIETPLAIYVGGDEGDMVEDAMTFFKNRASAKLPVAFYVALHENHASVIPTTISRALRFASQDWTSK